MYALKTPDGLRIASVHEGTTPVGLDAWPVVDAPQPVFNPLTHELRVRGYAIVNGGTEVRRLWATSPKSEATVWAAVQAQGYSDATTGLTLKTTESAQRWFTSQVTSLRLAQAENVAPATVQFWLQNEQPHTLPLQDFFALMLRYSAHCQAIFADYAP
jgi:hypothetical protein